MLLFEAFGGSYLALMLYQVERPCHAVYLSTVVSGFWNKRKPGVGSAGQLDRGFGERRKQREGPNSQLPCVSNGMTVSCVCFLSPVV